MGLQGKFAMEESSGLAGWPGGEEHGGDRRVLLVGEDEESPDRCENFGESAQEQGAPSTVESTPETGMFLLGAQKSLGLVTVRHQRALWPSL